MSRNSMRLFVCLIAVFAVFGSVNAQKYAFLNSGNLLSSLPEVKKADEQLKMFQEGLMTLGRSRFEKFENEYLEYQKKVNEGRLSQVEMQEKEAYFQNAQEEMQKFQTSVQQRVAERRQELLGPILKRVDEVVAGIAKEHGYSMVFDSSTGDSLYAGESDDIYNLVKDKISKMPPLELPNPSTPAEATTTAKPGAKTPAKPAAKPATKKTTPAKTTAKKPAAKKPAGK